MSLRQIGCAHKIGAENKRKSLLGLQVRSCPADSGVEYNGIQFAPTTVLCKRLYGRKDRLIVTHKLQLPIRHLCMDIRHGSSGPFLAPAGQNHLCAQPGKMFGRLQTDTGICSGHNDSFSVQPWQTGKIGTIFHITTLLLFCFRQTVGQYRKAYHSSRKKAIYVLVYGKSHLLQS